MNTVPSNTKTKFSFTSPVLTDDLLKKILSGEETICPELASAQRMTKVNGLCPFCSGKNDGIIRIKSDGMGVESVAMLLEWLFNPASRDFCLCQLVIVTAQTGDEHEDSKFLMEKYILPLYRYYRLRFVELARRGELEEDGIVILQDTREAHELHIEGYYKLSDHLQLAGTVPQYGGEHRCSLKFKAFVIEYWLTHCFNINGFYHVFGYNCAEQERADKCSAGIARHNEEVQVAFGYSSDEQDRADRNQAAYRITNERNRHSNGQGAKKVWIAFGYNRDEQDRAEKSDSAYERRNLEVHVAFGYNAAEQERAHQAAEHDNKPRIIAFDYLADEHARDNHTASYDTLTRVGFYPLIVWKWTREMAQESIFSRLGVYWEKSACVFCPFSVEASKGTEKGIARFRKHPALTARGLLVEYNSLCLNERGALYNTKTLQQIVFSSQQVEALRQFELTLSTIPFSLYEVKRIYTAKGKAARSVIRLGTGSRDEMAALFTEYTTLLGLRVKTSRGINYALFAEPCYTSPPRAFKKNGQLRKHQPKPKMIYPSVEGFLVIAPARIGQKVRGQFTVFEERFAKVASERGIVLPATPGTSLISNSTGQRQLFFNPTIDQPARKIAA